MRDISDQMIALLIPRKNGKDAFEWSDDWSSTELWSQSKGRGRKERKEMREQKEGEKGEGK